MLEPIQLPEYHAATLTEPGRTLSRRTSAEFIPAGKH
jgi:hypothetical protein